jgi:hypothetical protein
MNRWRYPSASSEVPQYLAAVGEEGVGDVAVDEARNGADHERPELLRQCLAEGVDVRQSTGAVVGRCDDDGVVDDAAHHATSLLV